MTFSNFNGDLEERVTDTTANRFKQTYIKGFIDISGGDLITRPSTKIVSQGGITSGWSDASYVFPPDPIQLRKMSDRKYSHLLQSSSYGNGYYHIDVSDGFTVNVPSNATYPTASIGLFDKGEPDSGFDAYHGLYDGSLKVSNYTLDPSFTVSLPELIKVTDIRLRVYSSSNSPSSTSSIKVYGRTSTNNSFTQISGTNTINGFNGTTPELSFSIIRLKVIPTGKYVGVSQFKVINSAGTDIVLNQTPIQRDMTPTTDGLNPLTNLTKTTDSFHSSEVSSLRSLTVCDLNVSGNVFALKEWWIHNAVMGSVNSVNDFQEFWVEFLDSNYNVLYISNGVNVLRENIIGTFGGKVKLYAYDANNTLSATTTSDYFPYRHHLTWVASTETEVTEIRIEPDVTTNDFHINELYIHGRRKQTVQLTDGITFTSNDYENVEDTIDVSYVPHTLLWKGNYSVDSSLDYGMTGWNAFYSSYPTFNNHDANSETYGGKFANYIMTYVDNQYDGLLSGNFVANTSGSANQNGQNLRHSPAQLFAVYATDTSGFTYEFSIPDAKYSGTIDTVYHAGTIIGGMNSDEAYAYSPKNQSLAVSMYIDASGNNQTIGGHWAQIDFPFELRMTHIHYAVLNIQKLSYWEWDESPKHGAFLGWNGTNWVKLCDYSDMTRGGPSGAYMSPGESVDTNNFMINPNRTIPVDTISIGYYSKLRMVITEVVGSWNPNWSYFFVGPFAASGKVRTQRKTSLQLRHNQNDTELAVYDDNNKDSTLSMRSNKISFYRSIDNGKKDYIPFFPQCVFANHTWLDQQGGNNTGSWKNYQGTVNNAISPVVSNNLVKYTVFKRRGNNVAGTYLFYAPYKSGRTPETPYSQEPQPYPNHINIRNGEYNYPIFPFVYADRVTGLTRNSAAVKGLESVFTNGTIMRSPFIEGSGTTYRAREKRAFYFEITTGTDNYLPHSSSTFQKSLSYIDYDGSPKVSRAGFYVEMMTPNPMRYIHWYARHTGGHFDTGNKTWGREGRDFHLFGRTPNGNLYKLGDCYDLKSNEPFSKPDGDTWNNNFEVRKVKLARSDMPFVSIVVHLTRVYKYKDYSSYHLYLDRWGACFAGLHSFDAAPDLYTKLEIKHDDDATRLLAMSRNGIPKNLILNDHTMDNDDANFGHTSYNFSGALGYSLTRELGRRTTGMVGIGTSKPVAPLTVYGMNGLEINEALYNKSIVRMGWDTTGASESSDSTIQSNGVTSLNYTPCIYGRHSIVTSNYLVARYGLLSASDERIKTNIIDISDSSALDTLRLLAPKTYNYKNPLDMGHRFRTTYGFIAQDVSAIMPDAVTIDTDHIPNIMESGFVFGQTLTISNGDFISVLNLDPVLDDSGNRVTDASGNIQYQMPDYDLEVKFATSQRIIEVKVESVIDAKTLLLDATSDLQPYECFGKDASDNIVPGRVFVIGTNVNDFHKVNKSAIFTVATAALQEVDRQLQADKTKVASLETQCAALLARIEALETAGS